MVAKLIAKAIGKKAGRPKRRRGPKPKPKAVLAKKTPVRKKSAKVVRSSKENAELKRLISSQKRDDAPDSNPLPRRRATGPEGSKPVEQGPLLSKVQLPEKMSKAQARKLIMQGKAKVRTDKNGKKKLVSTGEYAPARGVVAEEMGLSKRGKLPSEAELKEMGGFEMRKRGGKAKVRKPISIKNALKKRASAKAETRIQAAANPKKLNKPEKPKNLNKTESNVSPREYLVNRAKTTEAMRNDVNINLNRDAKPVPKKKPKYRNDEGSPSGTAPKKSTKTYTPRKKYEGGIDSYETPFGTIKADSSDDAFNFDVEEKDGGYLKKDMMMKKRKKGGVVKRRMGGKVGGYGKALRGY